MVLAFAIKLSFKLIQPNTEIMLLILYFCARLLSSAEDFCFITCSKDICPKQPLLLQAADRKPKQQN